MCGRWILSSLAWVERLEMSYGAMGGSLQDLRSRGCDLVKDLGALQYAAQAGRVA